MHWMEHICGLLVAIPGIEPGKNLNGRIPAQGRVGYFLRLERMIIALRAMKWELTGLALSLLIVLPK